MRQRSEHLLAGIVLFALVIAINILLFSALPALHRFFRSQIDGLQGGNLSVQTAIEYKKPEEKEKKVEPQKIRDVQNSRPEGPVDPLLTRFSPDLSVEGGSGVSLGQQELGALVFEEGEVDEWVVPIYRPEIPYSERARDLGVQGTLEAIVIIGVDGKVESVEIIRSPHHSISSAARKVMMSWRYKPARHKGIPVKTRARQEVVFRLD